MSAVILLRSSCSFGSAAGPMNTSLAITSFERRSIMSRFVPIGRFDVLAFVIGVVLTTVSASTEASVIFSDNFNTTVPTAAPAANNGVGSGAWSHSDPSIFGVGGGVGAEGSNYFSASEWDSTVYMAHAQFADNFSVVTSDISTGVAIQPLTTYTLSIDVGVRVPADGQAFGDNFGVQLRDTGLGGSLVMQLSKSGSVNATSVTVPGSGQWETWTGSYSTGAIVPTGDLHLRVLSIGPSPAPSYAYVAYDNVVLSAVPVPEPTTLALLGTGVLGLAAAGLRRHGWRQQR